MIIKTALFLRPAHSEKVEKNFKSLTPIMLIARLGCCDIYLFIYFRLMDRAMELVKRANSGGIMEWVEIGIIYQSER